MCLGLATWDWALYVLLVSRGVWISLSLSSHWPPIALDLGVRPYGILLSIFWLVSWCCHCEGNCIVQATVFLRVHGCSFPDRWRRHCFRADILVLWYSQSNPPLFWDLFSCGQEPTVICFLYFDLPILDLCNSIYLMQKEVLLIYRNKDKYLEYLEISF